MLRLCVLCADVFLLSVYDLFFGWISYNSVAFTEINPGRYNAEFIAFNVNHICNDPKMKILCN